MRSRAVVALLGALLAGAVLGIAPELARRQIEARASAVFGTTVVGRTELGWGQLRLTSVEVDGIGTFDEVRIEASLLDLAWRGREAVRFVSIQGCDLEIEASRLAAVGRGAAGEGGDTRPAPDGRPAASVAGCTFRLVDDERALVAASDVRLEFSGDDATISLRDVALGEPAEASAVEVTLALSTAHAGLSVESVELTGPRARAGPGLRQVLARLERLGTEGPSETSPGGTHTGRTSDADPAETPLPPDVSSALPNLLARLFERVGDRATLSVRDGVIEAGDPATSMLEELTFELSRLDATTLRSAGTGRPRNGGAIQWDLVLIAEPASISGSLEATRVPLAALLPFLPELPLARPEETLVSASLVLDAADPSLLDAHGSVSVEGLTLEHPRIASDAVRDVSMNLSGRARWSPSARRLSLEELSFELGRATASVRGSVEWAAEYYSIELHAELPPTACQEAVHAIPSDLLGELTALRLEGTLAGEIDVRVDSRDLDSTHLAISVRDRCRFAAVPASIEPGRFLGPFVHRVVETDGDEFEMETGPGTSRWTPLSEASPFLVHAVLAHEDASFFRHHGFAPWAIRDALVRNLREGRYVMGASTITMQLVKNVFLHREKTIARKIQEVLLTWWVESVMTKERILELYLNIIELGPAVYGIRAGSEHWFGRDPAELSVAEAVYLACILPNPAALAAEHRPMGGPPAPFRRRMRNLLTHLAESGRIDEEALAVGLAEIETLTFHAPGAAPPAPRIPAGHAATLPIAGWGASAAFADETTADWLGLGSADDMRPSDDEILEHPDDRAALDDSTWGWEEVGP